MNDQSTSNYKTTLTVIGAVVAIYGVFGWLDVSNYAQGGWNTDGNNTVTEVLAGSPAEAGGLQVGDYITSLGGIATSDADGQSRRGRPEVGETWEFVVTRDGAEMSLNVTFGEPVAQRKLLAYAGFLVGFCFIVFTLRAFLQLQTKSTMALATAGIMFSLVFITGPYFESYTLRTIDNALSVIIVFLGIASILTFLLTHLRDSANRLLYLPGLAAGLFIAYRILATPEATSALNTFANVFVGSIVAFYFIGSVITVYRSYSGASDEDRNNQGLKLLLIGTVAGLLPPIVTIVVSVVAPQVVLPGQNFYFLSLVLLPITWSIATLKKAEASGTR